MKIKVWPTSLVDMSKSLKEKIAVGISVVALFVSITNSFISYYGIRNSENTTKEMMFIDKRPYITIKPEKFDDNSFVHAQTDDKAIKFIYRLKLTNFGQRPAKNIVLGDTFVVTGIKNKEGNIPAIIYKAHPFTDLAPGDSIYINPTITVKFDLATDVACTLRNFENCVMDEFKVGLTYGHDLSDAVRYTTSVSYRISKNDVIILSNTMSSDSKL